MMTPVIRLHSIDVSAFLTVLDSCSGNVYLVTPNGDKLNLRSKLGQLIGLSRLIDGGRINEAFVMCDRVEDESRLFRLNLLGETTQTA